MSVAGGGTTFGDVVSAGGFEGVGVGGTAISTTVSSGGEVAVSGTTALAFSLPLPGFLSDTVLLSGGIADVGSDSTLTGVVVSSGGIEIISYGATASGSTIETGGILFVAPGGTASGAVLQSGAALVSAGVVVDQPTIGATVYTSAPSGLSIVSGASEYVFVSGTASNTSLVNSGFEHVYSGGSAIDTAVSGGSTLDALAGGVLSGAVLLDGGIEHVYAGGRALGTTVSSGGAEGLLFRWQRLPARQSAASAAKRSCCPAPSSPTPCCNPAVPSLPDVPFRPPAEGRRRSIRRPTC